jgi:pimeloyl-ACP methyl ester carboxylesterase
MTTWVLLRGWTREARHWGGFTAALQSRVPLGDRVLAVDLPGNGRRHAQFSPSHVDAMVHAVRDTLPLHDRQEPVAVIALSLGGMVALRWACLHPGEIAACVLINSSVSGLAPFWHRLRPSSYLRVLGLLRPGLPVLERERRILALTSNLRAHDAALAAQWAAHAQECPVTRANVLRQLRAAARFRPPVTLPAVPMLLLASEADRLVSAQCSKAMAGHWQTPLRLHPAAGHDLPLDAPDWVVSEILRWWRSLPR